MAGRAGDLVAAAQPPVITDGREGPGGRLILPAQARAIAAAYRAGVPARQLAVEYRVTVRTIYRAIHRGWHQQWVVVGAWRALYSLPPDGPPVRVGPWVPLVAPL